MQNRKRSIRDSENKDYTGPMQTKIKLAPITFSVNRNI
jgi:hypothetical protein